MNIELTRQQVDKIADLVYWTIDSPLVEDSIPYEELWAIFEDALDEDDQS